MRRRLMLKRSAGVSPVLPAEYQRVEWIARQSGNPYINTGIAPKKTQIYSIGFRDADVNSIFASGNSSSIRTQLWIYQNTFYVRYWGNNNNSINPGVPYTSNAINECVIDWLNRTITKAGMTYSIYGAYSEEEIIYPLVLLAQNIAGTISSFSSTKLYYFSIEENGNKLLDLVPCYRKSDGVIGMYDTISQSLFTNAGDGIFTKGADV